MQHAQLQRFIDGIAARSGTGFSVTLPNGQRLRAGDGIARFTVVLHDMSVLVSGALRRHLGLMEAYIRGALDIEGDFAAALATGLAAGLDDAPGALVHLEDRLREWLGSNRERPQAALNARFHYGLPEAFFRQWLDEPLKMYTCAYWPEGTRSLEDAQQRKIEHVCRKIRMGPQDHVLDVGCGFGGFLLQAARTTGASGVGLNVVPEQAVWLTQEIERQHLAGRISVRRQDLRDIDGQYDKLVSIGVLEHAGRDQLRAVIASHARALKPGGLGLLQFIGHVGPRETDPFIRKHVFPGGWIPALSEVMLEMERGGLEVIDIENLRRHYAITLDEWAHRFDAHWPAIHAIDPSRFDEIFRRVWRSYLVGCAQMFRATNGTTHLYQLVFSKGNVTPESYPMGREFLYR